MSARRTLVFLLSAALMVGLLAGPAAARTSSLASISAQPALGQSTAVPHSLLLAAGGTSADVLQRGDKGAKVKKLQRRLRDLRYWVGPIDGEFGTLTQQAIFAFQKTQGLAIDGVFGPNTRKALKNPKKVGRQSTSGSVVEIDKKRQVLKLVRGGKIKWIFNTSTGTEKAYKHKGKRYMADTPKGKWRIFRQVKGWREGELGHLYNPKYFHVDGIAIHGYHSVPPYRASHGCARITMDASRFLWDRLKIGMRVWIY